VERRDAHSLAPVSAQHMPTEVAPLVRELNRLLARLAAAFAAQRAFTADAAHELRSPLTALRLQLQLLERAPDDAAQREARRNLAAAMERSMHLVEQLLTLARQEPPDAPTELRPVPLEDVLRAACADCATFAQSRHIELEQHLDPAAAVRGDGEALRILARNLIDNAVRYAPDGSRVQVQCGTTPEGTALQVSDGGAGIPPEERERVFDRFYRRAAAAEGGSGLGLAIVKAIADRHGARLTLGDSPSGGLTVSVLFPARS
jgi:two-component system OmpR family sensor kinase/two-component system sensor histidine kinase QseC